MSQIFISYRRKPSLSDARHLNTILEQKYGDDSVFFDKNDIPGGTKFPDVLRENIINSNVCIIFFKDVQEGVEGTLDRINEDGDWVRQEIEFALEHCELVIPLCFDGFHLSEADLPENIKALAERQIVEIDSEAGSNQYNAAVQDITDAIDSLESTTSINANPSGKDKNNVGGSTIVPTDENNVSANNNHDTTLNLELCGIISVVLIVILAIIVTLWTIVVLGSDISQAFIPVLLAILALAMAIAFGTQENVREFTIPIINRCVSPIIVIILLLGLHITFNPLNVISISISGAETATEPVSTTEIPVEATTEIPIETTEAVATTEEPTLTTVATEASPIPNTATFTATPTNMPTETPVPTNMPTETLIPTITPSNTVIPTLTPIPDGFVRLPSGVIIQSHNVSSTVLDSLASTGWIVSFHWDSDVTTAPDGSARRNLLTPRPPYEGRIQWYIADAYCRSQGWYLPSFNELNSLLPEDKPDSDSPEWTSTGDGDDYLLFPEENELGRSSRSAFIPIMQIVSLTFRCAYTTAQ